MGLLCIQPCFRLKLLSLGLASDRGDERYNLVGTLLSTVRKAVGALGAVLGQIEDDLTDSILADFIHVEHLRQKCPQSHNRIEQIT